MLKNEQSISVIRYGQVEFRHFLDAFRHYFRHFFELPQNFVKIFTSSDSAGFSESTDVFSFRKNSSKRCRLLHCSINFLHNLIALKKYLDEKFRNFVCVSNHKRLLLLVASLFIFGVTANENGGIFMAKRGIMSDFKISLRKFILQMMKNSRSIFISQN